MDKTTAINILLHSAKDWSKKCAICNHLHNVYKLSWYALSGENGVKNALMALSVSQLNELLTI